jgi:hypothetical protein
MSCSGNDPEPRASIGQNLDCAMAGDHIGTGISGRRIRPLQRTAAHPGCGITRGMNRSRNWPGLFGLFAQTGPLLHTFR